MRHRQFETVIPGSSLDHVIRIDSSDSRAARWGLTAAIAAHVVFFVVNWPTLGGVTPDVHRNVHRVYKVRLTELWKRPDPVPQRTQKLPARSVPIPDPDPFDPEPLVDENEIVADFVPDDWISVDDLDVPAPPAEPVAEPSVRLVGPEVVAPRKIFTVEPRYPETARKARIQGAVVLSLIIDVSGRVESVEVLRGLPLGLSEAASEAASQWLFEPSTYNGKPTAVRYILTVRFRLD